MHSQELSQKIMHLNFSAAQRVENQQFVVATLDVRTPQLQTADTSKQDNQNEALGFVLSFMLKILPFQISFESSVGFSGIQ